MRNVISLPFFLRIFADSGTLCLYKNCSVPRSQRRRGQCHRLEAGGTPAEVLRCIERAFAVGPSSKRIVEDILVLDLVLDKIIAAEGCVVPDEDMRNGRRARAAEWTSIKPAGGELKNKARASQRKETTMRTVSVHPDIEPEMVLLRARGVEHVASATAAGAVAGS
jgi:hypothetical protein